MTIEGWPRLVNRPKKVILVVQRRDTTGCLSFGSALTLRTTVMGAESTRRAEVAVTGLSALGLLPGKADADLGTPLGGV